MVMLSRVTFLSGSLERLHPVEHCVCLASLHRLQDVLLHLLRAVPMAAFNYRFSFFLCKYCQFLFNPHLSTAACSAEPSPPSRLILEKIFLKQFLRMPVFLWYDGDIGI